MDLKNQLQWNYLVALVRDLEEISLYIEFDRKNYKTFSVEVAKAFLATGSEVDVTLKILAKEINYKLPASPNVGHYSSMLNSHFPEIFKLKVYIPRYGITIKPFNKWKNKTVKIEGWWKAYSGNVKHSRDSHYHEANLGNLIEAISALFLINVFIGVSKVRKKQKELRLQHSVKTVFRYSDPKIEFIQLEGDYYNHNLIF